MHMLLTCLLPRPLAIGHKSQRYSTRGQTNPRHRTHTLLEVTNPTQAGRRTGPFGKKNKDRGCIGGGTAARWAAIDCARETDISPHPFVFSLMAFLSRFSHLPRRKARETRRLVYLHRQTRDMCRCRGLREHARTHARARVGCRQVVVRRPSPPPPSSFHVAGRRPAGSEQDFL